MPGDLLKALDHEGIVAYAQAKDGDAAHMGLMGDGFGIVSTWASPREFIPARAFSVRGSIASQQNNFMRMLAPLQFIAGVVETISHRFSPISAAALHMRVVQGQLQVGQVGGERDTLGDKCFTRIRMIALKYQGVGQIWP